MYGALESSGVLAGWNGRYVQELDERSTVVELDEANLYCTADDPFNHDVGFVVDNGSWDE